MLTPLTEEQYEKRVPEWAKLLDKEARNKPFKFTIGMRVYDVLYADLYRNDPFGVVLDVGDVSDEGWCMIRVGHGSPDKNGLYSHQASAASYYYVPVPDKVV